MALRSRRRNCLVAAGARCHGKPIASVTLHIVAIVGLVALVDHSMSRAIEQTLAARAALPDQTTHMIFIARPEQTPGGGGGGGGNRQPGPIRRAEGIGRDRLTVPIVKSPPAQPIVASPVSARPRHPAAGAAPRRQTAGLGHARTDRIARRRGGRHDVAGPRIGRRRG